MKSAVYLSPLFLLFGAACGGDAQSVSAQTIGPGEHCAEGGIHMVIDGEDYYVCDGTDGTDGTDGDRGERGSPSAITTTWLEEGAEGNTCPAEALEITVLTDGEAPVTELICQAESDELSPFGLYIDRLIEVELDFATAFCLCFDEAQYDSQEECEEDRGAPYSVIRYIQWCQDTAYKVYDREPPEAVFDFFNCATIATTGFEACMDILDSGDACTAENQDAFEDCTNAIGGDFESCETVLEADEEAEEWLNDFGNFTALFCDGSGF